MPRIPNHNIPNAAKLWNAQNLAQIENFKDLKVKNLLYSYYLSKCSSETDLIAFLLVDKYINNIFRLTEPEVTKVAAAALLQLRL